MPKPRPVPPPVMRIDSPANENGGFIHRAREGATTAPVPA
jgi:hypothetical protein